MVMLESKDVVVVPESTQSLPLFPFFCAPSLSLLLLLLSYVPYSLNSFKFLCFCFHRELFVRATQRRTGFTLPHSQNQVLSTLLPPFTLMPSSVKYFFLTLSPFIASTKVSSFSTQFLLGTSNSVSPHLMCIARTLLIQCCALIKHIFTS